MTRRKGELQRHRALIAANRAQNAARVSRVVRAARDRKRAADLALIVRELQAAGVTSLRAIADELNARHIATPRRGQWWTGTVSQLLARIKDVRNDDDQYAHFLQSLEREAEHEANAAPSPWRKERRAAELKHRGGRAGSRGPAFLIRLL